MLDLVRRLSPIAFTILSLLEAIPMPLRVFAFAALLFLIFFEIRDYRNKRTLSFDPEDPRIAEFMGDWVRKGGRVVIATRDMSWARDDLREQLFSKATTGALSLVLPKEIPLAQELKRAGADVYTYPDLDCELQSRFTIVNYKSQGAEVAIGRRYRGKHQIEQFSDGDHPAFGLAEDLIDVIRRFHDWRAAGNGSHASGK
jgi:hypothetical protein